MNLVTINKTSDSLIDNIHVQANIAINDDLSSEDKQESPKNFEERFLEDLMTKWKKYYQNYQQNARKPVGLKILLIKYIKDQDNWINQVQQPGKSQVNVK